MTIRCRSVVNPEQYKFQYGSDRMSIQFQSIANPFPIQFQSLVTPCQSSPNPVSILCQYGAHLSQSGTEAVPIQRQLRFKSDANKMPIQCRSSANPSQSGVLSCANLMSIQCQFDANLVPIQYQSIPIQLQSMSTYVSPYGQCRNC